MSDLDDFRKVYQEEVKEKREQIVVIHRLQKIDTLVFNCEKSKLSGETAEFCLNNSEPTEATSYLDEHWKKQVHEHKCNLNILQGKAIDLQELLDTKELLKLEEQTKAKLLQEEEEAELLRQQYLLWQAEDSILSLDEDHLLLTEKVIPKLKWDSSETKNPLVPKKYCVVKEEEVPIFKWDSSEIDNEISMGFEELFSNSSLGDKAVITVKKSILSETEVKELSKPRIKGIVSPNSIKAYVERIDSYDTRSNTELTYFKRYGWNESYWSIITKEELDDEPLLVPPNYEIQFDTKFDIYNFPPSWTKEWIILSKTFLEEKMSIEEYKQCFHEILLEILL
jgi:hypothetical protein